MPVPIRDSYSGAIVFHPTPEEQTVKELTSELQNMKEEMSKKLSELDSILKESTKSAK